MAAVCYIIDKNWIRIFKVKFNTDDTEANGGVKLDK